MLPDARPMPAMAPTIAWDVLMGSRRIVMIVTVMAADSEAISKVVLSWAVRPLSV